MLRHRYSLWTFLPEALPLFYLDLIFFVHLSFLFLNCVFVSENRTLRNPRVNRIFLEENSPSRAIVSFLVLRNNKIEIIHKIYETKSSFHVKYHISGKVQFWFFRRCLLVLTKYSCREED